MTIKHLLIITAAIEAGVGLVLLVFPSLPVSLLLGTSLDTPSAGLIARVTGAALLTLGVACWLAREDGSSPAARGLIAAMMFYNLALASLLVYANLSLGLFGIALWPAVVGHVALAVFCFVCLRPIRPSHAAN